MARFTLKGEINAQKAPRRQNHGFRKETITFDVSLDMDMAAEAMIQNNMSQMAGICVSIAQNPQVISGLLSLFKK